MPLKTVLIGFGKIAQANASDPLMAAQMPFSTHAQVLNKHPDFQWCAVVDTNPDALETARGDWHVSEAVEHVSQLSHPDEVEVVVLATPPDARLEQLRHFKNLRAVLVEKPLAHSLTDAQIFIDECRRRNIAVQVNMLRRADTLSRQLAAGKMQSFIGRAQAVQALYCRGLINNGIHIIDLMRLLFGEITNVQATSQVGQVAHDSPLPDDPACSALLRFESGLIAQLQAVDSRFYRENGLQIWGESGRLNYLHSGFSVTMNKLRPSTLVQGEMELDLSSEQTIASTLGQAFYEMYSNLARHLQDPSVALFSPDESALQSMSVLDAIRTSIESKGECAVARRALAVP